MTRPLRNIACIGEVMIELIANGPTADVGIAGDTYNTAVYLSRQLASHDAHVSCVTALGTDRFSERILADMHNHGLSTRYVEQRADRQPGLYAIETDDQGERSFTYWRSQSAARKLFATNSAIKLDRLLDFDLIYLSGITLAILPKPIRANLIKTLKKFRTAGGFVAFDSNYRPALWEDRATAQACIASMWEQCDIALPSADDEMAIFCDPSEKDLRSRFAGYGVERGALKRGHLGPIALSANAEPPEFARVTTVVDSTAAGDSFNAGYLAELIKGRDDKGALLAGHALASKVIQHRGAIIPL